MKPDSSSVLKADTLFVLPRHKRARWSRPLIVVQELSSSNKRRLDGDGIRDGGSWGRAGGIGDRHHGRKHPLRCLPQGSESRVDALWVLAVVLIWGLSGLKDYSSGRSAHRRLAIYPERSVPLAKALMYDPCDERKCRSMRSHRVATTHAIAFHGTSAERAASILSCGFRPSMNDYDWLGDGVYFFQEAPSRAWEWACTRHPDQATVVGARIGLSNCMDFLDLEWAKLLGRVYDEFLSMIKSSGTPMPTQTGGAHRLDREVINYAVRVLEDEGVRVESVRGAFSEGKPAFPNSAILDKSHIQIAVRNVDVITNVWQEMP